MPSTDADEVRAQLDDPQRFTIPVLEALYLELRELRDSRFVSCLFSDFVSRLGLPKPIKIDTGHFRFVLPFLHANLREAVGNRFRDEREPEANDVEPMICSHMAAGVHRDLDVAHQTFQINFFFALHPLSEKQTLVLFPNAYRQSKPYYPDYQGELNPAKWGYGDPLQIPLDVGDMILFHSQHFHGSSSQTPERNRLSVEIRVASACDDDNATLYRRTFWDLRNFEGAESPFDRAKRLIEPRAPLASEPSAETPQLGFRRLFADSFSARQASYGLADTAVLSNAPERAIPTWDVMLKSLDGSPFSEDRHVALARTMLARGTTDRATSCLRDVANRTDRYFWLLEVARIAGSAGNRELARYALEKAVGVAARSNDSMGQYSTTPVRHGEVLQLTPRMAHRIARTFLRQVRKSDTGPWFLDPRTFLPPALVSSYMHADVFRTGFLYTALPAGSRFTPEGVLRGKAIVHGGSESAIVSAAGDQLGSRLAAPRAVPRSHRLLGKLEQSLRVPLDRFRYNWDRRFRRIDAGSIPD